MTPQERLQQIDARMAEIDSTIGSSAIQPANNRLAEIDARMAQIDKELGNEPLSVGERGMQVGRGVALGIGSMADLLSRGVAGGLNVQKGLQESLSPRIKMSPERLREFERSQAQLQAAQQPFMETEFANKGAAFVDTLAGKNLAPTDTLGHVLQGTGEFASVPYLGGFKAAKGVAQIGKALAKEGASALGASTLLHATPNVTSEGSGARVIEDMAKTIFGSYAGSKAVSKATLDTIKNMPKTLKEAPMRGAAKLLAKTSTPEKEVFDIAKKEGIPLPINIGMNSKPLDFLQQNYFRSMFTSKAYKDVMKNSHEAMVNKVNKSIDSLGESNLKPQAASK